MNRAGQPAWRYRRRGYALHRAWTRLRQSVPSTLLTLLVLGVALTLPVLAWLGGNDIRELFVTTDHKPTLTLYLSTELNDLDGAALSGSLAGNPAIDSTEYISTEEALALVRDHTDVDLAVSLLNDNPLPGSIIVHPVSTESGEVRRLAGELGRLREVEDVQFDLEWVEKLSAVAAVSRTLIGALGLILTLIALTVIANTVRLEILRQSREIEVSRLLGANTTFVQRPLLYLGALYGLAGGGAALMLSAVLLGLLRPQIQYLADSYASDFALSGLDLRRSAIVLLVTTLLGLVSALVTVLRESRITECNN